MHYLLLLYADETAVNAMTAQERMSIVEGHLAFRGDATAGVLVAGEALTDAAEAATVRSTDGLVTDGPFVESKDQLGGYYVIACESRDVALRWAARVPAAPGQVVEVRPIVAV